VLFCLIVQAERQCVESSSSVGSLQQTIHKLRDEVATLRVECDNRGARCQALETELKERTAVRAHPRNPS
jgi:regulator of replication initiation timing